MNNTFNIKRFGLAFRKDLIENGKSYLLMFLTLLGIIAIVTIYITWYYHKETRINYNFHYPINISMLIYLSFIFIAAGIWFASTFANPMNSKLKRISYLVSPASNLEKYLIRWIITTVGFIVAFFVAMWIADALRVAICSIKFPEADIKFLDISKLVGPENEAVYREYLVPKSVFIIFLSLYFLFQSIFLLGSTFWEKASFIKTFTVVAAIIAAYIFICRWTILLFYGDLQGYFNVLSSYERINTMSEVQSMYYVSFICAVITIGCWILAFFRIKESEIINRL